MKTKQIILITFVVFFAILMFAIISADIQENKEKAVLQERARLQASEKEPLNKCMEEAEADTESERKNSIVLTYTIFSESYRSCLQTKDHGREVENLINSGNMTAEEYCAPPTSQQVERERQRISGEEKSAKDECYKRYK